MSPPEREELLESIRAYFVTAIEDVMERASPPDERVSLRGCGDASRYRTALALARERDKFAR